MADRIKGITVQIGGDTTGLSNALKDVQKEIGYLNTDLKDINRLLKLDPTNTTLLAQKQKMLANNINFTEQKLKTLKIAQQQMDAAFEKSEDVTDEQKRQYDNLQREIAETEIALKNMQQEADDTGAKMDALTQDFKETETALDKLEAQAKKTNDALSKISTGAKGVSENANKVYQATVGLSTGAAAALGGIVTSAIQVESSFAGVEKTVNGTEAEMEVLKDDLLGIAKATGENSKNVMGVAEAAGQLGIERENIADFTKTMIDMGVSTNLTAEEAAVAFAQIGNITGTSVKEYSNLGSAIVGLGNNFATNEAKITEMTTRLAASGTLAGLSEPNILALATAMSSVGIEAEAGGTAMTQTFDAIEKAVIGGGTDLEKMAEIAGMSSKEFSDAWKNEPIQAIQNFIGGLGELDAEGESATEVLDELGMSGIRQSNMLKSLGLASETLADAIGVADSAWEENTALTDEASKRYETMERKIMGAWESIKIMASELGENLFPVIENVVDKVKAFADEIANMDEKTQNAIIGAIAFIAAIAPLAKIVSIGADGVAILADKLIKLNTGLMNFGISLGGIAVPVAIVLAVIGGLVAAFKHLWDTNEGFRTRVTEIWNEIKASFEEFGAAIVERLNELGFNFENITEVIKTAWDLLCTWMAPQFEITFAAIQLILSTALDVLLGILDIFIAVFQGDWQGAWEAIKGIFTDVWENIKTFLGHSLDAIKAAAEEAWIKLNEVTDGKFGEIVTTITEAITGVITDALNWGREICDNIAAGINAGIGAVQNAINAVASALHLPPVDFSGIMIGGGGSSHSGGSVYNTTVNNTFNNASRTSAMSAARTINRELGMMMN